MVSSPAPPGKRRFSDQSFAGMVRGDGTVGTKRRQTIDGALHRQQVSVLNTSNAASSYSTSNANPAPSPAPPPLKQKVSLGSAAASAYYFSGLPKTPLSNATDFEYSSKKLKRMSTAGKDRGDENLIDAHTETSPTSSPSRSYAGPSTDTGSPVNTTARNHGPELEETVPDLSTLDVPANDISSSTESSDLMNRSVLSDTTELTASNFVLAASSRQKFMRHLAMRQTEKENVPPSDHAPSPRDLTTKSIISSSASPEHDGELGIIDSSELIQALATSTTSIEGDTPRTSPNSLRKLTLSLMQSRLQKDEQANVQPMCVDNKDETSSSKELVESEATNNLNRIAISKATSQTNLSFGSDGSQLDVSKSSLDDLFDGLLGDNERNSLDSSSSLLVSPNACDSESRASTTSYQFSGDKLVASLPSPGMSPIATEATKGSSFRLTPSKAEPKLTPTKLKASPRRILNLNTKDSPARNTRSATKTVMSPEALDVPSPIQEQVALKCDSPPLQTSTIKMSRQAIGLENQSVLDSGKISAPWPHLAPKSILNSAKKRSRISDVMTRKTVAFGSPEAAEYHIGSPSVSLTPMHPMQAKAMFSIPRAGNRNFRTSFSSEESNSSSMDEGSLIDNTMGTIGKGPGSAFQTVTSCGDFSMEDKTIELESSLSGLVNLSMPTAAVLINNDGSDITTTSMLVEGGPELDQNNLPHVNMQQSFDEEFEKEDTKTVQLETSISGLLQASNGTSEGKDLNEASSSHNSNRDETVQLETSISGLFQASNEEDTVQLETSISGLLQASTDNSEDEDLDKPLSTHDSIMEETVQLETSISSLLQASNDKSESEDLGKSLSAQHSNQAMNVQSSEAEQIAQHSCLNSDSELQQGFPSPTETMPSVMGDASPSWQMEDEENTVELEADMSAIFAMASQGDVCPDSLPALKLADRFPKVGTLAPQTNRLSFGQPNIAQSGSIEEGQTPRALDFGLSDSPVSTSVRQRISCGSRGRFSLAKSSRLSIASEGSAFAFSPSAGEASFSQENPEMNNEQQEELLAMTSEEIDEIVDFGALYSERRSGFNSVVQSLSNTEQDFYFQITDSLRSFSMAVCGEVEEKVALSSSGQACFDDLLQSVGVEMTYLQHWVRQADGTAEIKVIAASVRAVVEQEWCDWERTVLDSLVVALQNIPDEIDPEIGKLDHCMTLLDDLNESLSMAAGKAVMRAKHLRFARHENMAMSLAAEIADLERQLGTLDHSMNDLTQDLYSSARFKSAKQKRVTAQEEITSTTAGAESSHSRFISVKVLCGVSSVKVKGASISVAHSRCAPLSCLKSNFFFDNGSLIRCNLVADESGVSVTGRKQERLSKSSAAYVKARCSFMAKALLNEELGQVGEICCLTRELNWTLGRVELTARELMALQKRFDVSLERNPNGESAEFLVRVSFSDGKDKDILVTRFDLNSSYPFGPLNVSFDLEEDEGLDLRYFQRQLMKNAKPGFGYLSRACDVISAALKSR